MADVLKELKIARIKGAEATEKERRTKKLLLKKLRLKKGILVEERLKELRAKRRAETPVRKWLKKKADVDIGRLYGKGIKLKMRKLKEQGKPKNILEGKNPFFTH